MNKAYDCRVAREWRDGRDQAVLSKIHVKHICHFCHLWQHLRSLPCLVYCNSFLTGLLTSPLSSTQQNVWAFWKYINYMLIVTCLKSFSTVQFYQYERQFDPCLPCKLHLFILLSLSYFNHSDLSITQSQDDPSYVRDFKFICFASSVLPLSSSFCWHL